MQETDSGGHNGHALGCALCNSKVARLVSEPEGVAGALSFTHCQASRTKLERMFLCTSIALLPFLGSWLI